MGCLTNNHVCIEPIVLDIPEIPEEPKVYFIKHAFEEEGIVYYLYKDDFVKFAYYLNELKSSAKEAVSLLEKYYVPEQK